MIAIKLYTAKKYYIDRTGDPEFLPTISDLMLHLQTTVREKEKNIHVIEEPLYTGYGETNEEAIKSIKNYLKANPNHPVLHRYEIVTTNQ